MHAGSLVSRKEAKVETPPVIENRPSSQISDYNMPPAGMTSTGNNRGTSSGLMQPAVSGLDDGYGHMFP